MANPNFAHDFLPTFFTNRHEWVVVSQTVGGNTVVAYPKYDAVIKYGPGVTQGEAEAQKHARLILDPAIIYVPQVYGFFSDDKRQVGYLIMERIDGFLIDADSHAQVLAIETALNHLQSFSRDFPEPFHSGELQGVLWENSSPVTNNTVQSLEQWMNLWQDERISL